MSVIRHDASHALGSGPHCGGGGARSQTGAPSPFLSIVVPAKNESASLEQLTLETAQTFRPLVEKAGSGKNPLGGFELVVVDDGSTDDSIETLRRLMAEFPELRPLRMERNVGQSAALAEGIRNARGDWIATLDADLQNPPVELAKLWEALPGHDAALGWRIKREDVWSKRIVSKWANRIRNQLLRQSIRDTGCSVRIFRRDDALRLPLFFGAHRFLGPLLIREGCDVLQVPVEHRPRTHGTSHYSFRNRSFKVVIDLLGVAWLMRRPLVGKLRATPVAPARKSDPNLATVQVKEPISHER